MNETSNPYQTPTQPVEDISNEENEIIPAGKWLRFANLLIDYIGHTAFGFVVGILIALRYIISPDVKKDDIRLLLRILIEVLLIIKERINGKETRKNALRQGQMIT